MKGGGVLAAALAGAGRHVIGAAAGRERSGALAGALLLACLAAPAQAQNTHILLISGLGGDPAYTDAFHGWLSRFADAATEKYGIPPDRITYLGEKTDLDPTRIRARSTADNIRAAFAEMAAAMAPSDELVILLAGHGTFRNGSARFNIPGPDLTAEDMALLLTGLGDRRVTFVNTASASGPFVRALSGPNRTIIAATRTGRERNVTRFGLHFVDAFAEDGADVDKDSRVSMLEAFSYALREVQRQYESANLLMTEHAVLDDNGDGEGSRELDEPEGDGALARMCVPGGDRGGGGRRGGDARVARALRGEGGDRGAHCGSERREGADVAGEVRGRAGGVAGGAGGQEPGDSGGGGRVGVRHLHYLEIRNFKGFGDKIRIELDHPAVLVGPNNCGKTTALQAIALWSQAVRTWFDRKGRAPPRERTATGLNRLAVVAVPVRSALTTGTTWPSAPDRRTFRSKSRSESFTTIA